MGSDIVWKEGGRGNLKPITEGFDKNTFVLQKVGAIKSWGPWSSPPFVGNPESNSINKRFANQQILAC